jgi:GntR family transcriptional regulator
LKVQINQLSGVPLYVQIREHLRSELDQIEAGTPIPTEVELGKRFRVSRITVRRAIEDLVAEGLLVRQQGRGTFVQKPKLTHELNRITSWTEQLKTLGFSPETSYRKIIRQKAPAHVAETLCLAPSEAIFRIERIRLAQHEPICYMINFLPAKLLPGFKAHTFNGESLYDLLAQDFGLIAATAVDTVGTRSASAEESHALSIEHKAPILSVRRVSYLQDGTPLELAIVASRGDRYQYQVALTGASRNVSAELQQAFEVQTKGK